MADLKAQFEQAAKDIKDLITNSSGQVQDGVQLVNRAGADMTAARQALRYLAHGDNTRAVAEGIGITGGIITGAIAVVLGLLILVSITIGQFLRLRNNLIEVAISAMLVLGVGSLALGGADVVYDPVGGDTYQRSTKCIAFEGRIVVIGFTSGRFPELKAAIAANGGEITPGCALMLRTGQEAGNQVTSVTRDGVTTPSPEAPDSHSVGAEVVGSSVCTSDCQP